LAGSASSHRPAGTAAASHERAGTAARVADVEAGVRAAIARYTHALDDGRVDDVIATYCVDGGCDIPGLGTHSGHDALRAAYAGFQPKRPVRHVISNVEITSSTGDEAQAVSDVVVLAQQRDGAWAIQVVGRYRDTLRHEGDDVWRFRHRAAEFVS
jgi:hypothetical protein